MSILKQAEDVAYRAHDLLNRLQYEVHSLESPNAGPVGPVALGRNSAEGYLKIASAAADKAEALLPRLEELRNAAADEPAKQDQIQDLNARLEAVKQEVDNG